MLVNFFRFGLLAMAIVAIKCDDLGLESGFKTVYNNYKQCEDDPQMLACLKLKALKLVDRALSINNIPIVEGVSLMKKEEGQRSLDDAAISPIDENTLPADSEERNRKLDSLLWERIKQFFDTRSLQLKVNKLFLNNDSDLESVQDGRGKKDKKGGQMYMMLIKGGLLALAYKALALLAGKALLVSKIALVLSVLLAAKKLFSGGGGHHSQKTTYEIVKTPIITQSHQYSGAATQNGHYANGGDFSSYENPPYARSLDNREEVNRRIGVRAIGDTQTPRYVAHILETVQGRSLPDSTVREGQGRSLTEGVTITESDLEKMNLPYAHLTAYGNQLRSNIGQAKAVPTENTLTSSTTQ